MAHLRARLGNDRKRNGDSFTRQGKHGNATNNDSKPNGGSRKKYANFSKAAARQAELAANGGSLLRHMPILEEQRRRDEDRGWGRRRSR